MDEKEALRKLVEKIDEVLADEQVEEMSISKDSIGEEWSTKTYNFMRKYGHIP